MRVKATVNGVGFWGGCLAAAGLVWFAFAPLVTAWDFLVFWQAGHDVVSGIDPYPVLGTPEVHDGHQFVYPYLMAFFFAPLSLLPAKAAASVYLLLSLAAIIGAGLLAGQKKTWAVPLLLLSSVTIVGLQIGSLNALLFLAIIAAWRWRDRPWIVGAVVAAAVVAKLFLIPLIAWLVLTHRFRATAVASSLMVALLAAGWFFGPLGAGDYVRLLGELSAGEIKDARSVGSMLTNLGAPHLLVTAGACLVAAMFLGSAWWVYRRGRGEIILYSAGICAGLALSPIIWSHYLLLLAAPLMVRGARSIIFLWFAALSWIATLPHHLSLGTFKYLVVFLFLMVAIVAHYFAIRSIEQPNNTIVWTITITFIFHALAVLAMPPPISKSVTATLLILLVFLYVWIDSTQDRKPYKKITSKSDRHQRQLKADRLVISTPFGKSGVSTNMSKGDARGRQRPPQCRHE